MFPKLTRTMTSLLPVDNHRTGSCHQCGACCRLPFTCVFLRSGADGKSYCAAYRFRPPACRKFPRTRTQLELVQDVCGFSFTPAPHATPACVSQGDDCLTSPVTVEG